MSDYTLCVALTWQIAAEEAAESKQEYIEPEHLLIGLCKLVSFTQPDEIRRLGLPEAEAAPVKAEIDILVGLYQRFAMDPVALRRELRQRKNTGLLGLKIFDRPREGRIIHRSASTRQVFTRATELAHEANAPMTTVMHLLAALIDHPNLAVPMWLRRKAVDVVALKQAALAAPLPRVPETFAPPTLPSPVRSASASAIPTPAPRATPTTEPTPVNARVYTTHSILLAQASPEDALTLAQRRLKIFYALGQEFGATTTAERLLHVLAEQLALALPQAQRGALLMKEAEGELLLHDHWPSGAPTVDMALAQRASDERHPVMWNAPLPNPDAGESARPPSAASALYVPLLWGDEVLGVIALDNPLQRGAFTPDEAELVSAVAAQAALFLKQQMTQQALQRQEALRQTLLNQFSPKVAELLAERGQTRLGRALAARPVVVLRAQLRGFSALSARLGAEGVVQALDEILSIFAPIVQEHGGALDKNEGEVFIALFSAEEPPTPEWWLAPVRAAHEMHRTVQRLETEWQRRGWLACDLGIGLHTGQVWPGVDSVAETKAQVSMDELIARAAPYAAAAQADETVLSQAMLARVFQRLETTARVIRAVAPEVHPDLKGYVFKRFKDAA